MDLRRQLVAEGLGTALLVAGVVGSGIMGDRLAGGNVAIALLANAVATGALLAALILIFGPLSGAHLNPAVSFVEAALGRLSLSTACGFGLVQICGGLAGVAMAHVQFMEPLYTTSTHVRTGWPQVFSEGVATFGLVSVVLGCSRSRPPAVPFAVGAYITAAYWFTSSTSFANPAVTIARALTNTFSGIRPADVPAFVAAQMVGALAAAGVFRWLWAQKGQETSWTA